MSVREAVGKFSASNGRIPKGLLASMIIRENLGNRIERGDLIHGVGSKFVVERYGQDWIKIHFPEQEAVRLRTEPAYPKVQNPVLVPADDDAPALFEEPVGHLVLMWRWDVATGMLRSLWLTRVVSLDWKQDGCVILEKVEIKSAMESKFVPEGIGSDEDDLDDMLSRWDDSEPGDPDEPDESGAAGAADFDDNEDEDDDEGDTAVGAAG